MSGLHRPVVVDPREANLADVNLIVRCFPGGDVSWSDANAMCDKVGSLFENQGANVRTTVGPEAPDDVSASEGFGRPDLVVELRSRLVHHATHPLTWVACIASFTLLPAVRESSFAQDVSIRDGTGFLLVTDSLQGRLVERFGAGTWAGNAVFDLARDKEDRLGGDAAQRDLSRDLYRQLSQLVFNAKIHGEVLQESAPRLPGLAP